MGLREAQVIHAAGESSPGGIPPGTFAIALAARDEAELLAIEKRLTDAGASFVSVREPDSPWNGSLMAIGLAPAPKSVLRPLLSSIPCLKEVPQAA